MQYFLQLTKKVKYIEPVTYGFWTDRIGETKVVQNSTFVSTCFRSGTTLRAPGGYGSYAIGQS